MSVVIHLPHEVMLHICETLTPRETCTMMLGLGKRSVIFRSVSEVAILRGSALGKQLVVLTPGSCPPQPAQTLGYPGTTASEIVC